MMGRQHAYQHKVFVKAFNLDKRIRPDHVLRKIFGRIDRFCLWGSERALWTNGNVSVPPPVILMMMLLLVLYYVSSERELMLTIPERLDWMWFLGGSLQDAELRKKEKFSLVNNNDPLYTGTGFSRFGFEGKE